LRAEQWLRRQRIGKAKEGLAAGKGATVQEFVATVGDKRLEIDVAPWGEGHLKVNGWEIAHVDDAKDRRQAFRKLAKAAEHYLHGDGNVPANKRVLDHDSYREG
jgi:hypothetical protein